MQGNRRYQWSLGPGTGPNLPLCLSLPKPGFSALKVRELLFDRSKNAACTGILHVPAACCTTYAISPSVLLLSYGAKVKLRKRALAYAVEGVMR